jgi:hypothetical protein
MLDAHRTGPQAWSGIHEPGEMEAPQILGGPLQEPTAHGTSVSLQLTLERSVTSRSKGVGYSFQEGTAVCRSADTAPQPVLALTITAISHQGPEGTVLVDPYLKLALVVWSTVF